MSFRAEWSFNWFLGLFYYLIKTIDIVCSLKRSINKLIIGECDIFALNVERIEYRIRRERENCADSSDFSPSSKAQLFFGFWSLHRINKMTQIPLGMTPA